MLADTISKRGLERPTGLHRYSRPSPYRMPVLVTPMDTVYAHFSSGAYISSAHGRGSAAGTADELVLNGSSVSSSNPSSYGSDEEPYYLCTVHGFSIVLRYRLLAAPADAAPVQTILQMSDVRDAGGVRASSASIKLLRLGAADSTSRLALQWRQANKTSRANATEVGAAGSALYAVSKVLAHEDQEHTYAFLYKPSDSATHQQLRILRDGEDVTVRRLLPHLCKSTCMLAFFDSSYHRLRRCRLNVERRHSVATPLGMCS